MTFLPDVNVWVALAAERHVHHHIARLWFGNLQDGDLAFCRVTQMGLLRLLSNRHVIQEEVLAADEAWRAYRAMRSDWRIVYLVEPDNFLRTDGKCLPKANRVRRTGGRICLLWRMQAARHS
jgi:uncharacterized protein